MKVKAKTKTYLYFFLQISFNPGVELTPNEDGTIRCIDCKVNYAKEPARLRGLIKLLHFCFHYFFWVCAFLCVCGFFGGSALWCTGGSTLLVLRQQLTRRLCRVGVVACATGAERW